MSIWRGMWSIPIASGGLHTYTPSMKSIARDIWRGTEREMIRARSASALRASFFALTVHSDIKLLCILYFDQDSSSDASAIISHGKEDEGYSREASIR